MTLKEASEQLHISTHMLEQYKSEGFLPNMDFGENSDELSEGFIQRLCLINFLQKSGMDTQSLKSYLHMLDAKSDSYEEQTRLLRKQRSILLEEIHGKQQLLDELDYMIWEIKKVTRQ